MALRLHKFFISNFPSRIRAIEDFSSRMLVVGAMLAISGLARPVSKTSLQQQYLGAEQHDWHSSLQT
ncbi:hypothetical protein QUB08_18815 [Microcoleus sp. BR0-C5]|uniref:hypothetical protein n=1 Tax=Microcoleus sp. BR0-C5 TaxID=2818713 RepID=UPI002FD74BE6